MLDWLAKIVDFLNGYIWGPAMLVMIVGSGLYFTIRMGGFQFTKQKGRCQVFVGKGISLLLHTLQKVCV